MREGIASTTTLEHHFANTFFSALYFSATDLIQIASEVEIKLSVSSREQLLKKMFDSAQKEGKLGALLGVISEKIQERIEAYEALLEAYPASEEVLISLIGKSKASWQMVQKLQGKANE